MITDAMIKRIKIQGSYTGRRVSCPYCGHVCKVTLVTHLRRCHPSEWEEWTDKFIKLYNETNDVKRVMRVFSNNEGQPILSWTVIEREVHRKFETEGAKIRFLGKDSSFRFEPTTEEYPRFATTVWDVPRRGTWAVHQPTYRGNWAPQIPRALIEMYSKPGDQILDPFVGGGTTLLEAWLLGRHALGFDISQFALQMSRARLRELQERVSREGLFGLPDVRIEVRRGDARVLDGVDKDSIDMICTHPPYGAALQYSHDDPADLSLIPDPHKFLKELTVTGRRFFEVLRPGSRCAVLIGDLRRDGKLHALGFGVFRGFCEIGFDAEEVIIKTQNHERSTEFYFYDDSIKLRLAHEYLFVFRRPA